MRLSTESLTGVKLHMYVTRKIFVLSALTLALSACGGGGGDDTSDNTSTTPPPPPPPYSVTVDSAESVEESSSLTVNVSGQGGEGSESITASIRRTGEDSDDETGGNASDVTVEQNSEGFVFGFGDITYKRDEYTITIEATKGNETKSEEFDVVVKNNTSGDETAAYVNSVQSVLTAQRQFIAEWLMVKRLVKGVNLSGGDIDIKDIKALYVNATSGDGVDDNSLLSAYVNDERLTGYDTNSISESDAFDSFRDNVSAETCEPPRCFSEHLVHVKPMFDYIFERSGDVIHEPAYGDVAFDAGTGTFSIFYTAPDNGSFDEQGNWTFKPEFEYLSDIIVAGHAAAQTFSSAE